MAPAGCFCEKIRLSVNGDQGATLLCHCLDCRKISGSTYSTNLVLPEEHVKIEKGTPKTISKIADSGKNITSSFCGDCGTTVFRKADAMPGKIILKAGVLDDSEWPNKFNPNGELFVHERASWQSSVEGANQLNGMS